MEVFMHNVGFDVSQNQLTTELAIIFHGPRYSHLSSVPLNFHVYLFKDKKGRNPHSGAGRLTLPSEDIGRQFLGEYGEQSIGRRFNLTIRNRSIKFTNSKFTPRHEVLESIARGPYIDPKAAEEKERVDRIFREEKIMVHALQFGWICRDFVFSVEWEYFPADCYLSFDNERREIRIRIIRPGDTTLAIAIRFNNLETKSAYASVHGEPVILLTLESPPTFESESAEANTPRKRFHALPIAEHASVSPYVSQAVRLVCRSHEGPGKFRKLSRDAGLHRISDIEYFIDRRELFSPQVRRQLDLWLKSLNWCIAFQVESLLKSLSLDMTEMLALMPHIVQLTKLKGKRYTAAMLAQFGPRANELYWDDDDEKKETILDCFSRAKNDFEAHFYSLEPNDPSLFQAYHVEITPTTMRLSGPHPERSNRIIRQYHSDNHESFLRVSFVDEGRLHYRFDRDVDGPAFIRDRVGPFLLQGLRIAGRDFQFLAYSQSALKEHAVWFVKPFRDHQQKYVNASAIIKSIGSFENLQFDANLMYCPARYGARLSQAFTATDVSVAVHPEEVILIDDIKTEFGNYCFTDGVGTMSRELAIGVSKELKSRRVHGRHRKGHARALQIRFQGSKGVLSVDHTLHGRAICLRPSMIKFNATSQDIEIARAFDKPGPYFLNRPLIMLLENLGVKYDVFKIFQDKAVRETEESTQSLERAARMFETYGLGTSYRLTSVMLSLAKLDIDNIHDNKYYQQILDCAIHHVLRLLKNRARIPIPDAWTLVGVADVHNYLQAGQIFACIKPTDGPVIYLEGPVVISRSPTIHPGDVQIAQAIGVPPPGSCFAQEPLFNTVVFSVLGSRPLPSCLGGGDLDGDVYNLIPLNMRPEFKIPMTRDPAVYAPASRKLLDRPSTMADVAEFVMEYINSDVVGIIAINWLIIADQSQQGIFDERCLALSNLHSDAVDYPKSGNPVALGRIPKLLFAAKPDWNAPETVNADSARYYKSNRAIGRLFRDITLPANVSPSKYPRRRKSRRQGADELSSAMNNLSMADDEDSASFIQEVVRERVHMFIDLSEQDPADTTSKQVEDVFQRYVAELSSICTTYSLSYSRPLTEEEAMIGTIVQKTSQPRQRQDMTAKLRERTDVLVRSIRGELAGDDEVLEDYLQRAWLAWELSIARRNLFGAESFGWVALGAIFDAVKEIEDAQLEESRSRFY